MTTTHTRHPPESPLFPSLLISPRSSAHHLTCTLHLGVYCLSPGWELSKGRELSLSCSLWDPPCLRQRQAHSRYPANGAYTLAGGSAMKPPITSVKRS